jgi:hypothetical protein
MFHPDHQISCIQHSAHSVHCRPMDSLRPVRVRYKEVNCLPNERDESGTSAWSLEG